MKKENINIRIDPDTKEKVKQEAKKEGRSISNWVIRLIDKFFSN